MPDRDDKCGCGGDIVDAGDEFVCEGCGTVTGYGVEIPDDALPSDTNLDFGLTTKVGGANKDYAGNRIGLAGMAARLRVRNKRTQTQNRSLPAAMAQISALRVSLGMTGACAEYAAYLFRRASSSGLLVGRVVRHCTAAAVLLACRKHGLNRTIANVMDATGLKRRDIYRTYRLLYDRLGVKVPVPDPVAYITKIADAAGVDEATRRDALAILSMVDRSEIAGKDPKGMAASAIYLSCVRRGEVIYRRDIAEAAGVAETTLTTRYQSIVDAAIALDPADRHKIE